MPDKPFDIAYNVYSTNDKFKANSSTVIIRNQGTQNCRVDKFLLQPGETYVIEAYPGEVNEHTYEIVFTNNEAAGCELVVAFKQFKGI